MESWLTLVIVAVLAAVASWYWLPMPWARLLLRSGRSLAGLRDLSIDVDGQRWHYLQGGQGPVLLLIHGFGGDADNWLLVARRLSRKFTVLAPDLPGFGTSSRAPGLSFDVAMQSERLKKFTDALGLAPSHIAGNSMGGWIAAHYARYQADTLESLWLIAPLGVRDCVQSPILEAIADGHQSPIKLSSASDFSRLVIDQMFGRRPFIPRPLRLFYAHRAVHRSASAVLQFGQVLASKPDLESLLAAVDIPVLLQWGDRDMAVDVSAARALARAAPDITIDIQPGVGHLPMIETPTHTVRLFIDFHHRRTTSESVSRSQPQDDGL